MRLLHLVLFYVVIQSIKMAKTSVIGTFKAYL